MSFYKTVLKYDRLGINWMYEYIPAVPLEPVYPAHIRTFSYVTEHIKTAVEMPNIESNNMVSIVYNHTKVI